MSLGKPGSSEVTADDETVMNSTGTSPETKTSIERVKAWKRHRVGPKPPFRDYKIYYRTMRWGPFSYWTWRGIGILISCAVILYTVLSMLRHPFPWFVHP